MSAQQLSESGTRVLCTFVHLFPPSFTILTSGAMFALGTVTSTTMAKTLPSPHLIDLMSVVPFGYLGKIESSLISM